MSKRTIVILGALALALAVSVVTKPSTPVPAAAPATLASQMSISGLICTPSAGLGYVRNNSGATVDVIVSAQFLQAGTMVGDGVDAISGIAPGERAEWTAPFLGTGHPDTCRADVSLAVAH